MIIKHKPPSKFASLICGLEVGQLFFLSKSTKLMIQSHTKIRTGFRKVVFWSQFCLNYSWRLELYCWSSCCEGKKPRFVKDAIKSTYPLYYYQELNLWNSVASWERKEKWGSNRRKQKISFLCKMLHLHSGSTSCSPFLKICLLKANGP